MWVHLTRVHQLPELVNQSLVTQRRVRCLGEGWILTEHAQDLVSDWTETAEFSPENVPTHPKHANFASRNASFSDPIGLLSERADILAAPRPLHEPLTNLT